MRENLEDPPPTTNTQVAIQVLLGFSLPRQRKHDIEIAFRSVMSVRMIQLFDLLFELFKMIKDCLGALEVLDLWHRPI